MGASDPRWRELLNQRPDDPFWIDDDQTVSRGELMHAIDARTRQWHQDGWSDGHRVALDTAPTLDTVVSILSAMHAGLSVLLLPRRELAARRAELAERAGAQHADASPLDHSHPIPGTVWVRSSGSLGRPRWIIHTAGSLLAGAGPAADHLDFGVGARWRLSLPMDHVGGLSLVFRALVGGGALLAGEASTGDSHRSLVATQLRRLLDLGEAVDLRCLLVGGGPIGTSLKQAALEAGLPLVVSYGLSETGALLSASSRDDEPELLTHPHYAGRPLVPGSVAVDEEGVVLIRGNMLCGATADEGGVPVPLRLTDGWLSTGDLGRLDNGCLFITGRRDNVMISGGEKLPAEELEAALLALPGVLEAVVVPVADEEFGQRPGAFIRWMDGREQSLAAVRRALAFELASWKLPVAMWPLPEGVGFKPDRAALTRLANPR